MSQIRANGIAIEVETFGDPARPAVLLVMGLGMQLIAWPEAFCRRLVEAGYFVIRFDNRDIGLSARITTRTPVRIGTALLRYWMHLPVRAPYTLSEMAADSVGVLDALSIAKAHVVGVSMGGMIGQVMAAEHPARLLTLTSIMSTTGSRWLPPPSPKIARLMLSKPPVDAAEEAIVERYVRLFQAIGSPAFPTPEEELRERIRRGIARSYDPAGSARQLLAIIASGDRSAQIRTIRTPTLVIHGTHDPLAPPAGGRDTARKIPGARLVMIPGMGHDLASGLLHRLATSIVEHVGQPDRTAAATDSIARSPLR